MDLVYFELLCRRLRLFEMLWSIDQGIGDARGFGYVVEIFEF